jgi:nucleoid-associated protein YgaU
MPVAASTPVPSVPDHHAVAANPEPVATQPAQVDMPPEPPAVASKGEGNLRDPERADSPPTRREPVSIPRGDPEATIVEPGETLEDVAVRVYGGRGGIETLLRANREVLSRRKGPLRPGLQLWTPAR